MKFNEKYDRYVTKGGLVYRYDSKQDKLVLCKLTTDKYGYLTIQVSKPKRTPIKVHRLVYETFKGEISNGLQIDHINTVRNDNRLSNLRCVTSKENNNNPLTIQKKKERTHSEETRKKIGEAQKGKTHSEFGTKFKEHYKVTYNENKKLYDREYHWYLSHNKVCRWEAK